jgi:hypothetical protein
MIIWRILSSEDERFATAIRRGTWKTRGKTGESYRVQPMLIEWEPGFKSVEVGDFTDPSGGSDLMIVGGVAKSLKKKWDQGVFRRARGILEQSQPGAGQKTLRAKRSPQVLRIVSKVCGGNRLGEDYL